MAIYKFLLKKFSYKTWVIFHFLGVITLNGCVTSKKTTYLQEYNKSEYAEEYTPPENYLIQPNDNLYVNVATPDPRLSAIFNSGGEGGTMTANEAW
jgi:hypothetical protein